MSGVFRVGGPAIEGVLGVVEHLAPAAGQIANRLGDHVEVLLQADAEDLSNVKIPRFADDRDHWRCAEIPRHILPVAAVALVGDETLHNSDRGGGALGITAANFPEEGGNARKISLCENSSHLHFGVNAGRHAAE